MQIFTAAKHSEASDEIWGAIITEIQADFKNLFTLSLVFISIYFTEIIFVLRFYMKRDIQKLNVNVSHD